MSLIKSAKLTKFLLRVNSLSVNATRSHWNKDYKPAPYPVTEKERLAAAAKYGLHPSEYQTYPDDGTGYGDYPMVPRISSESKDQYYPYDNPELKRNFNEPVHPDYEIIREDRYDVSKRLRMPLWGYLAQFLAAFFGLFTIYGILENFKMFHPAIPRQYPKEGKVHYTFELKEN